MYSISVCSPHYYGFSCNSPCGQCRGDDACNNITGHCPNGCKHHWRGSMCNSKTWYSRYVPCDGRQPMLHSVSSATIYTYLMTSRGVAISMSRDMGRNHGKLISRASFIPRDNLFDSSLRSHRVSVLHSLLYNFCEIISVCCHKNLVSFDRKTLFWLF